MVRINGGTFMMGSPVDELERFDWEGPQHQVTVSSFYMGKYQVTQKEWYEIMGTTVLQQRDKANRDYVIIGEGDNYPMYYVNWYEVIEYCNRRSQREGLTPAYTVSGTDVTWNRNANGYRLPTEAEWEYACRAGTTTPFSTGNNITTSQANYDGKHDNNATGLLNHNTTDKGEFRERTTPVGSFAPNAWGLYDMYGNVDEWCWDWYGDYGSGAQTDPTGAVSGYKRVLRGGSWLSLGQYLGSAGRDGNLPYGRDYRFGFRLARSAQSKPAVSGSMTLDQAIRGAAENIGNNVQAGQKIAVLNFSSPSDRFSVYVIEELSEQLVNGKKLVVVDRRDLDFIRQEEGLHISGEVSDESAQSIGKKLGAQLIVSGSLTPMGGVYRFRIRTLNVESAAVEASVSVDIGTGETRITSLLQRPVPANMVRINGGTFMMGSPDYEPERWDGEGPQHQVTVSSFYMGKYQVTQKEYREIMGTNLSYFKRDNLPVEMVNWYDALVFCNKLSMKEGLSPAYRINGSTDPSAWGTVPTESNAMWDAVVIVAGSNGYRLPTEAQWEYACRAGTVTPFSTGNNITTSQANYNGNNPYNNNAKGTYRKRTTPVGSFASNAWGLYDMHGNVWEWCWNWYGSYSSGAQTDPTGAVSGSVRVLRGGSWGLSGHFLRSANRDNRLPFLRGYVVGFRLVRPQV
jgi:formylglycine-generating enzyme required for sulfatase activity